MSLPMIAKSYVLHKPSPEFLLYFYLRLVASYPWYEYWNRVITVWAGIYVRNAERDKGKLGVWPWGKNCEKQGDAKVKGSEDSGAKETEVEIRAVHTQKSWLTAKRMAKGELIIEDHWETGLMAEQGSSFGGCQKHKMDRAWKYLSVNVLLWEIVREDGRLWEGNWLEGAGEEEELGWKMLSVRTHLSSRSRN